MVPESFLRSIGSAVFWKSLDRIAGFVKHLLIAGAIGLSAQLDVFYMAMALLGVFVFSWANLLDVVAVPTMVRLWQEGRERDFKQVASGLFLLAFLGSAVLAILLYVFRKHWAGLALGFDEIRRAQLTEAVVWLLPAILLFIPLRLLGAVFRAIRLFSPFYQAEFITALVVLLSVILFGSHPHVLLWSFSLGVALAFTFLIAKAHRFVRPLGSPFAPAVRRSLYLAPGLLVLQGAQYVFVLTDRMYVSFLPHGAVSALSYATTLATLLPGVVALSGSFITVMAEQRDRAIRSARLNDLISLSLLMGTGITGFLLFGGKAMIASLLERGVFTEHDTSLVAEALAASAWMILPLLLIGPLDQVFQVEQRVGLMVRRTVLGMLTNVALNAVFLFGLGWGLFGVALATSISYWVMLLSGLTCLRELGYTIHWARHAKWAAWVALALVTVIFVLELRFFDDINAWTRMFSVGVLTTAALLLAALGYRGKERALFVEMLRRVCLPKGAR